MILFQIILGALLLGFAWVIAAIIATIAVVGAWLGIATLAHRYITPRKANK